MKISIYSLIIAIAGLSMTACSIKEQDNPATSKESELAQEVVDKAIEAHGGDRFNNARIEFDFRKRHYVSVRNGGKFQYERIFSDTIDQLPVVVRDVLDNDSFKRFVAGEEMDVSAKMKKAYSNSINSVLYFAQQPYFLNDPAVRKKYLGISLLDGQNYHKVQISFNRDGGGEDYEDVFIYWFHQERFTMDYLAYSYETDGGGIRFRKAYNAQIVEGIRFAAFINYKADYPKYSVHELGTLYDQGLLEELSRIENKNIAVELISPD